MALQRTWGRLAALGLAGLLTAGALLTGCGGSRPQEPAEQAAEENVKEDDANEETAADDASADAAAEETASADSAAEDPYAGLPREYTYLIATNDGTNFFEEYEDYPAVKYWMEKNDIAIDFITPPAGRERDHFNTLYATGEYADILALANVGVSAGTLYEEGVALDITEEVEKYMPNYLALCDEMGIAKYVTNTVDGEKRYLQIYDLRDADPEMWGGFVYRRDWIVKYGTNPKTGEGFTSSIDAEGNYEDDVVFPCGETDPYYISDWEWMLDIFATALKEEGITDGYCMSLFYPGYISMGEIASGFGAAPSWYINEGGKCEFGGTTDSFRAYVECCSTWYQNGWIDKSFDERTGDIFFNIDSASVFSGKVGLWYGQKGQVGTALRGDGEWTKDMVVFGAPQPINDVYGDADCMNHVPTAYFTSGIIGTSIVLTDKMQEKNVTAFLKALDELFSEEGGMLRNIGFSKEQQEEVQEPLYTKYGFDSAYTVTEDENGQKTYHENPEIDKIDGLKSALTINRVIGRTPVKNVEKGRLPYIERSLKMWTMYPTTGTIPATVTNALTADQAEANSQINTLVSTYMSVEVPRFITGQRDIADDADWQSYVDDCNAFDVDAYSDSINEILE